MNVIRKFYPLWLREKVYFHIVSRMSAWPNGCEKGVRLEFAPVFLRELNASDCGHREIAWLGFYERELSRRVASLARIGGLLVDAGANIGYFSVLWVALNAINRALAFEPSPRNIRALRTNISAQAIPESIQAFELALGRKSGKMMFDPGPQEQSGWGGLTEEVSAKTIKVEVRRLDDLIPPDEQVAVLKIDTEGADAWVLEGAEKLLREKRIAHVFCERNTRRMQALGIPLGRNEELLQRAGYEIKYLDRRRRSEIHAIARV